jgi:hypothetical protein
VVGAGRGSTARREEPKEFVWAVGEESSDPLVPFDGRQVRVDQMQSTGHLDRLEDDLADVADLGVRHLRYGINWRRAEPERGHYDWALWDRASEACERLGLEMIVDLLHFGVPEWLSGLGAFLGYVEAFLARYGQHRWFTPVNEPFVAALMSGRLGLWNEAERSDAAFITALGRLLLADGLAAAAIRADRAALFVQAEAFGPSDPDERQTATRQLSFDLRYGVAPPEVVASDLELLGDDLRARLADVVSTEGVVAGHDFYPASGASASDYVELARRFHDRYGVPFMVAETSNLGLDPAQGPPWLEGLFDAVCQLRREGRPCQGICWYSRGDQHDWHTALTRPIGEVTPVGLFDMARRPRPAAAALRQLVRSPVR